MNAIERIKDKRRGAAFWVARTDNHQIMQAYYMGKRDAFGDALVELGRIKKQRVIKHV